ncbi:MAG: DUF2892 domain-containing protein [Chitinophagaceae bacterium]
MKKNVGVTDRIIRLLLSAIFVYLYFAGYVIGLPGVILLVLVGIFFLTSLFGVCLLYSIFGISTNTTKKPL